VPTGGPVSTQKMTKGDTLPTETVSALIVAADSALALSLESMLYAHDFVPTIHDPGLGLLSLPLGADTHLIVDFKLLSPDPGAFLSVVRKTGWRGAAVLMTERALGPKWTPLERCWTVEKPFVSANLLAVFREILSSP
jgi:hypothetical protein